MNNFANSLFTLLFGWARAVIQQLWSFSASSQFGGFLLWLGDHWTVLVLALVLFGTVVDMLAAVSGMEIQDAENRPLVQRRKIGPRAAL